MTKITAFLIVLICAVTTTIAVEENVKEAEKKNTNGDLQTAESYYGLGYGYAPYGNGIGHSYGYSTYGPRFGYGYSHGYPYYGHGLGYRNAYFGYPGLYSSPYYGFYG